MKLSLASASLVSLALLTGSGLAAMTAKTPAAATHAPVAAAQTDTAAIKLIDLKAHQLTLDDGKMFVLPKNWKLHSYKVGEKVKVSYTDHMGSMTVTKIIKA